MHTPFQDDAGESSSSASADTGCTHASVLFLPCFYTFYSLEAFAAVNLLKGPCTLIGREERGYSILLLSIQRSKLKTDGFASRKVPFESKLSSFFFVFCLVEEVSTFLILFFTTPRIETLENVSDIHCYFIQFSFRCTATFLEF